MAGFRVDNESLINKAYFLEADNFIGDFSAGVDLYGIIPIKHRSKTQAPISREH
jgi:hypothetical protein